jgi:AP2-like factor, ANT lineage
MDMNLSSTTYPYHSLSFSLSNNYHNGLLEAFSNSSSAPQIGKNEVYCYYRGFHFIEYYNKLDMHAKHYSTTWYVGEEGAGVVAETPKILEDFLGGGTGAPVAASAEDQLGCGGELGSIAAGFLRQYPAPSGMPENPDAVTIAMGTELVESDQARRPAETFGQRTSIYRGVTRYLVHAHATDEFFSSGVTVHTLIFSSNL